MSGSCAHHKDRMADVLMNRSVSIQIRLLLFFFSE